MTPVTVDPEFASWLSKVKGTAELRDPQGKVLGHFAPASEGATGQTSLPKKAGPNRTYSLREVYEHLLSITPDEDRKSILREKIEDLA